MKNESARRGQNTAGAIGNRVEQQKPIPSHPIFLLRNAIIDASRSEQEIFPSTKTIRWRASQ
jgi:hypothetical protein